MRRASGAASCWADMGADVVKIEPPGGQETRSVGPFYNDVPNRDRSLSFWHYNTSKRGVTLSLETEDGRSLFRAHGVLRRTWCWRRTRPATWPPLAWATRT